MTFKEYNFSRSKLAIFPILIAVIAISIYLPSLYGEFVMDDHTYFTANDMLTRLSPLDLKEIFLYPSNYWGELLPVRDYLYVLEFNLFGLNTMGYHIVSILFYLASAFVLFFWVKELVSDKLAEQQHSNKNYTLPFLAGCIAMTFFLLNPIYVESVAYISGQKDILSVFFVLMSLLFLSRAGNLPWNRSWKFLFIGVVFHYLAVLSKFSALSTILFVPFLWWIISKNKPRDLFKLNGVWFIMNIPIFLWVIYFFSIQVPYVSNISGGTPFMERIPRALNIVGIHLSQIVWPWPMSFGYVYEYKYTLGFSFFVGLLFLIVVLILFLKRRKSLMTLGMLLFGIYLLPVVQIFPEMANDHIYDRYLAIPLIGIIIGFLGFIHQLSGLINKGILYFFLATIAICSSIATVNYIPSFNNAVSLVENKYLNFPDDLESAVTFASTLIDEGEVGRAEKLINEEKILNNQDWIKEYLLGWILFERGEIDEAYDLLFSSSIKASKEGFVPLANIKLAEILIKRGNLTLARVLLSEIIGLENKSPIEHQNALKLLGVLDRLSETSKE